MEIARGARLRQAAVSVWRNAAELNDDHVPLRRRNHVGLLWLDDSP